MRGRPGTLLPFLAYRCCQDYCKEQWRRSTRRIPWPNLTPTRRRQPRCDSAPLLDRRESTAYRGISKSFILSHHCHSSGYPGMSTGDVPQASDHITVTAPPAVSATGSGTATAIQAHEPGRITLPAVPVRPRVIPVGFPRRVGILEGILVVLLLTFAFVVASFRANNSDLFLRLATGRLIAGGEYSFGTDPFTFTSEGRWVNHAWLFDVVCYLVFRFGEVGGGIALVVGKAVLMTLLAWLMLQAGTPKGERRWIPVVCAVLALLVASPRMYLQPFVLSLVLLGATLYLLAHIGTRSRGIWLLPVLCLLWVNTDEWFFIGPLTIALFLLGEFIQQRMGRTPDSTDPEMTRSSLSVLGMVLAASLAACLINPYHIHAFILPPRSTPTWCKATRRANSSSARYSCRPSRNSTSSKTPGSARREWRFSLLSFLVLSRSAALFSASRQARQADRALRPAWEPADQARSAGAGGACWSGWCFSRRRPGTFA